MNHVLANTIFRELPETLNTHSSSVNINYYSLRPEIFVEKMNVSRRILVLDTSIFIHFFDKYFRTEGVDRNHQHNYTL